MWKGLIAGAVNFSLGWFLEPQTVSPAWAWAGLLGFLSYGLSLAAFVLALRHLGSARTGAYFSTAPFVGVVLSLIVLREVPSVMFWPAAALMAVGVWLHLTEHHAHEHLHEELAHDHLHVHDEHHQHVHDPSDPPGEPHAHPHHTIDWSIPTVTPPIFTISTGMAERKFPQIIRNWNIHKGRKEHKESRGKDKTLPTALRCRFPLFFCDLCVLCGSMNFFMVNPDEKLR